MSFDQIIAWVFSNAPAVAQYVLMGLGGLVILGQAYIAATPTDADDKWYAALEKVKVIGWLLKFLKAFSPIQRKPK